MFSDIITNKLGLSARCLAASVNKQNSSSIYSYSTGVSASQRFKVSMNNFDYTDKKNKQLQFLPEEMYPTLNRAAEETEKYWPKTIEQPTHELDGMDKAVQDADLLKKTGRGRVGEPAESYLGHIKMPHPLWTQAQCESVQITHHNPEGVVQMLAYSTVWLLRRAFDLFTGYSFGVHSDIAMMRRITILETVAGIPGMVGGAVRHFKSLRNGSKDYGWIHSLIEEAENERMHLMTAMSMYKPSLLIRVIFKAGQCVMLPFYTIMYCISPKYCHTFVGYLEEEAVKTYTTILDLIDAGKLPSFECKAPIAARKYWHLPEGVTMRDVIANIRADEAHHRELNHCLAHLSKIDINPFGPGY